METTTRQQEPSVETGTAIWKSDPAHSEVLFGVRHMVIAEVTGKFREFDVTMTEGPHGMFDGSIAAEIRTASISTDNADRDNHLRSADFFDVEKHPAIFFKSASIEKTGDELYLIKGTLTLNGVTKPVELRTVYYGQTKDPWGNMRAGFKATTALNRYDFGLTWNQALETGGLLVGKNIEVTLNIELVRK